MTEQEFWAQDKSKRKYIIRKKKVWKPERDWESIKLSIFWFILVPMVIGILFSLI